MSNTIYYPLTSPQLSIWYTDRMYSGTSISNVAGTLRIKEAIDISILEKAINYYIQNNDGMRLRICLDDDGNPQQYVSEYEYKKIEVIDFSGFEDPVIAMQEWDRQETLKPFDILNQDLYRFFILKLSDTDLGVFLNTHHIISDAWSMMLFGNTVINYYLKLQNNEEESIKNIEVPSYIDYVVNTQEYSESARYQKDKLYWEQQFNTRPEITTLKNKKAAQPSIQSKRKTFIAPKKFTEKLKKHCSEYRTTPYPLFLSALAIYINRLTEKEDIIIGTPILNRLNQSEKNTVGMFVSTVPLRIKLKSQEKFSLLSKSVSDLCLSTYRHQRYPYEHILKYVREKFDIKENIFDIVLSYQNSKMKVENDIHYSTRWHFNGYQSNSLTIHINDRDDEGILIIDYDYHSDLYYDKEIEFIHQHILSLLWHALDNPDNLICKIEMLTENEKRKVLYDFNDTYADYPREKTINQLFEEQVERTPENIALVFGDQQLTYKELNQRANSLANTLRNKIEPNEIVGIMVYRSVEMIVGLLAILKAGGAYLPIEPEYPSERIKYILQDSGVNVVLTDNYSTSKITGYNSINTADKINYSNNIDNPINLNTPKSLAYVIYTSGSTGQPKGVLIEHSSVVNFVESVSKIMNFTTDAVVISTTTICFDVFVFEVFTSLLKGAKVVLANETEQRVPILTGDLIHKHKVNKLITTPGKMRLLLTEKSNFAKLKDLEEILLAGEVFPFDLLKELRTNFKAKIFNGYGPTEATVVVSIKELNNENRITIGKPIDNVKFYILDKYLNLMPIGSPGELYISGECLARGYLNRPELTAKSFIKSPFDPNKILYKTGDVARWYSKGEVDLLGRTDSQVKVNGYRIELEEIKKNILTIPGIQDAVVINQTVNNKQALCAYIKTEKQESPANVREYLSRILPDYMIPSFITFVPEIPLNTNGKVDKEKLPDPLLTKLEAAYVAPKNDTEIEIQKIWEKVLGIEDIGVNDVLFELGGDSLDIIAISTAIYKKYNIAIPLTNIREVNTIAKMANFINNESLSYSPKNSNLCLLKKGTKNLFFIHAGSGEIFNYINLSQSIDEKFTCWGIRMGFQGYSPYNTSIRDLALKYVNYITDIQPEGPYYIAGWCIGGTIAFEMANILEKQNEKINYLGLFNTIAPRHWDNIELFSPEGEINFIRKQLGIDSFTIGRSQDFSIDDVWESFVAEANRLSCEDVEKIKDKIPWDIKMAIPKFDEISIGEIIHYINCIRTLHVARALYFPATKIMTRVNFYNAVTDTIIEDKKENLQNWNKYCKLEVMKSDIEADHFSMFQSPNVEKLGGMINDHLKNIEG